MKKSILCSLYIAAVVAASVADADCIYPSPPDNIPVDGATASKEQMIAAMQAVKMFDTDITAYTACLDMELAAVINNPELSDEEKARRRQMFVERNNAAVDHAQQVADLFNEQLRAYNTAQKSR